MSGKSEERPYPTGGEFLLAETEPETMFTPEDFDETQRMIGQTVQDFVEKYYTPREEALEHEHQIELGSTLLREAGEMGILMPDVPEAYGGMASDKATTMIVSEKMAAAGSFAVTHGAHTGIGTLPLVYFGTEEQKRHYLPSLASGEMCGAYALTEPGSGSDALAALTAAILSDDGQHYLLNGTKQYVTNAGYAGMFFIFAKVDGDKFTCFVVDRDTPGLSIGPEEKKMGIRGSSTCALVLEDARVPAANVLGEVGKGHVIAFNILNVGRFKLGASAVGGCKAILSRAVPYTKQRQQFGQPISDFGLIRRKIADVAARAFVTESMVYRTAGLLDQAIGTLDKTDPSYDRSTIAQIEDFSIECSLIKVFATESLAQAAEEGVQMLGGYGYCSEYPLERFYRDERINRIFEGTNEINRMIVPGMLLKKALKGELPLLQAANDVAEELLGLPSFTEPGEPAFLEEEGKLVANMKKVLLATLGVAAQKHGKGLKDQQEILSDAADIIMETYACESGWLRTSKQAARGGEESARTMADMLTLYVHDAMERIDTWAKNIVAATAAGDEMRTVLAGLRRLTKHEPVNRTHLHDQIAQRVIDAEGYVV